MTPCAPTESHLGGLILPGLTLALSSLHQAAALLPALDAAALRAQAAHSVVGHDTRSAMSCAAVTMTIGAVERVAKQLAAKQRLALVDLVVSGGWAQLLAPELLARSDESLVLKGAKCMALGGSSPKNLGPP